MAQDSVIKRFMEGRWEESKPHYERLAERARDKCEEILLNEGIKAEYKHRAKDDARLEAKCMERLKAGVKYYSDDDIIADVKDLAGVRIALYFPNQKTNVSKLIDQHFKVHHEKNHTGDEHEGYVAQHYFVQVRKSKEANDSVYPGIVEIQVMSVLMNAWSNVGHDIVYKALSGIVSPQEENMLSGLNRHLSTGDWFLETFHTTYITRVEQENAVFANHFELGAYLSKQFSNRIQQREGGMKLGLVKTMHALLETIANPGSTPLHQPGWLVKDKYRQLKLNTPSGLEKVIKELDLDDKPGTKFRKLVKKFEPCEVTISVYLMYHIVFKIVDVPDDDPRLPSISHQLKLKIMISTMIWLDELFPSNFAFEDNLLRRGTNQEKRLVHWIHGHSEINQVILGDDVDKERERKVKSHVHQAWQFFRRIAYTDKTDQIMPFAFKLAKLVLCDFPKEALTKLEKRHFPENLHFPEDMS
jgi:ppGpp synthetase/RelA/SpoT-type nucleotidyltranferase